MKLEDDNYTRSISQSSINPMQERFFLSFILTLYELKHVPDMKITTENFQGVLMFFKLQITNNQVIVRTCTCKFSQSGINNQWPLSPLFRVSKHATPIGSVSAEVTRKLNKWITMTQYLLLKVPQSQCKNGFSFYFLLPLFELKTIPDLKMTTEIVKGFPPLISLFPLFQHNSQVVSITQLIRQEKYRCSKCGPIHKLIMVTKLL